MSLLERIQALIESEVQKQLMKYAQVISKKHDISLKLLLQDIQSYGDAKISETVQKNNQCIGVTAKNTQCTFGGTHHGYCGKHLSQRKVVPRVETPVELNPHVGHTMKECMFLAGCPACEKSRKPHQNLLIDI
jgi:hypothetical protein